MEFRSVKFGNKKSATNRVNLPRPGASYFKSSLFGGGGVKGIAYIGALDVLAGIGVQTTDFDLQDSKKKELVKSGRDGALKYFNWYDNLASNNQ